MGPQIKFFLNKFQLLPCSVHSVCRSLKSNTNAQTILCTWMALQNANAPSIFQSKHIVIIHNCTTQPTHHITSLSLSLSLFLIHIRTESFSNARKPLSLSLSLSLNTCIAARSYKIPRSQMNIAIPMMSNKSYYYHYYFLARTLSNFICVAATATRAEAATTTATAASQKINSQK